MKKHLKECSQQYKEKENETNPVSKIDCEIIGEIVCALDKLGIEELKNIVDEWKNLSDNDVLDMLLQWNLDNGKIKQEKQENKNTKDFIMFEGISLDVHYIKSISVSNVYNYQKGDFVYNIVLNQNVDSKTPYNNLEIPYSSKEKRDQEYVKIHEYLAESELITFH